MIKYKIQFHLLNAYKTKNVEENLLVSKRTWNCSRVRVNSSKTFLICKSHNYHWNLTTMLQFPLASLPVKHKPKVHGRHFVREKNFRALFSIFLLSFVFAASVIPTPRFRYNAESLFSCARLAANSVASVIRCFVIRQLTAVSVSVSRFESFFHKMFAKSTRFNCAFASPFACFLAIY